MSRLPRKRFYSTGGNSSSRVGDAFAYLLRGVADNMFVVVLVGLPITFIGINNYYDYQTQKKTIELQRLAIEKGYDITTPFEAAKKTTAKKDAPGLVEES